MVSQICSCMSSNQRLKYIFSQRPFLGGALYSAFIQSNDASSPRFRLGASFDCINLRPQWSALVVTMMDKKRLVWTLTSGREVEC